MFDFEKIGASKFYVAPSVERVVEFSPPDIDMDNVAKVLSLAVETKCVSVDALEAYAQVEGRTNFKLTYLDREGMPHGVDYNADFSVRVDGEFCDGDSAWCELRVVEADAQATDRLLLSAVLEVIVGTVCREDIEVLSNADGCYKTMRDVYVPKFLAAKSSVAMFDDEQDVGAQITSVLSLTSNAIVRDVQVSQGMARVKTSVVATVAYVESGEIKQRDFEIPLEEEFNLEGIEEGDTVRVDASMKSAKIILQGVTDDNVIRLEGEVQYRIWAFRCQKIEIVDDIFMLTNEIETVRSSIDYECFDGCGFFSERIGGTAVLGDTKAPAIGVSALPYARCYTTRAYVGDDGNLEVEGVANTDVIYTDENGYNSVRAEIPFALTITSEQPWSKKLRVKCDVLSVNATVRRDREIEITMTLALRVCGYSPLTLNYISSVTVGEEKAQNTSALSIYVASEGEEMLDVCKALSAMPEDILLQNPTMTTPLKDGERIVYFRSIS